MKKQILNLGKSLTKNEQVTINGGGPLVGGCDDICMRPESHRQSLIDDQLRRFGIDYSNCDCSKHNC
ncbi:hypothetical protein [Tenacibaculum sp. 190524A02b]|uniref:hypothetical protein n=1 Tax=Tenacibaculum vairaonense TaxID=3137860 RepID=UPI0032B2D99D